MTAITFIAFLVLMSGLVVALIARYVSPRAAIEVAAGPVVWFGYVGLMVKLGIVANATMKPPGVLFIAGPVALFLLVFVVRAASQSGGRVAVAFPLWILLATQSFRIGVELFLHQLWLAGTVPRMLTFSGANVDIYVGITAPLIAWLSSRGRWTRNLVLVWNALGLLALGNVVTRAILTTPGPLHRIHAEIPNLMFGTFPYTFIPAFFVPLAVVLHVLAIRSAARPV